MSAPSAKKRPVKKAAPRTAEQRAESNVAKFEEYRDRAKQLKVTRTGGTFTPATYTVTAAEIGDGIKQDAVFRQPESLPDRMRQMRFMSMFKRGEVDVIPEILIGLSDPYTFERILRYLDAQSENQADADSLLFGFTFTVIEKLAGPGAADVPGGTTGS